MKTLINSGEVFYLKSANVIGNQNIQLFLRQERKYSLKRNRHDNEYYYVNFLVTLCMKNSKEAELYCSEINKYFVDDTLSVDSFNENEIELIGGYDYKIKVEKYDESIVDQFKDDWIDRYLYATDFAFEQIVTNGKFSELIKEIKNIVTKSSEKTEGDILEKIKLFETENNLKFNQ